MVSQVSKCRGAKCLTWVRSCPFGWPKIDYQSAVSYIDAANCHGCGVCVAECPHKAIELLHNQDDQISSEIESALNF